MEMHTTAPMANARSVSLPDVMREARRRRNSALIWPVRWIVNFGKRVATYLRKHAECDHLMDMPDHVLKDIGVTREDVRASRMRIHL